MYVYSRSKGGVPKMFDSYKPIQTCVAGKKGESGSRDF